MDTFRFKQVNPQHRRRANIAEAIWDVHKQYIVEMHNNEASTSQILTALEADFGFRPSEGQLKRRMSKWELKVNLSCRVPERFGRQTDGEGLFLGVGHGLNFDTTFVPDAGEPNVKERSSLWHHFEDDDETLLDLGEVYTPRSLPIPAQLREVFDQEDFCVPMWAPWQIVEDLGRLPISNNSFISSVAFLADMLVLDGQSTRASEWYLFLAHCVVHLPDISADVVRLIMENCQARSFDQRTVSQVANSQALGSRPYDPTFTRGRLLLVSSWLYLACPGQIFESISHGCSVSSAAICASVFNLHQWSLEIIRKQWQAIWTSMVASKKLNHRFLGVFETFADAWWSEKSHTRAHNVLQSAKCPHGRVIHDSLDLRWEIRILAFLTLRNVKIVSPLFDSDSWLEALPVVDKVIQALEHCNPGDRMFFGHLSNNSQASDRKRDNEYFLAETVDQIMLLRRYASLSDLHGLIHVQPRQKRRKMASVLTHDPSIANRAVAADTSANTTGGSTANGAHPLLAAIFDPIPEAVNFPAPGPRGIAELATELDRMSICSSALGARSLHSFKQYAEMVQDSLRQRRSVNVDTLSMTTHSSWSFRKVSGLQPLEDETSLV